MTIHGIGVDIVEMARIEKSLGTFGDQFRARVFTPGEQVYCEKMKHGARHYAARFAAKEAVAKALGTGFGEHLDWTDVEVQRRDNGEPHIVLHGKGRATADRLGVTRIMISLSHADHYAAANAVAICAA